MSRERKDDQVKPKKHLGQHFLNDPQIAMSIVKAFTEANTASYALEIGPGMGMLTQYLLEETAFETYAIDLDKESITYMHEHFPKLGAKLIEGDFLRIRFDELFDKPFSLIGNFPYNISSQIVFRVIESREQIPLMVGMFQKEVAERICSTPRGKAYGIMSILTQAYYETEYLFTVNEDVFTPPPKVKSGVIRLRRRSADPDVDPKMFFHVVKTAFNQRRKKLRNALQLFQVNDSILQPSGFSDKRAEELTVDDFVKLTHLIGQHGKNYHR